jgi:hypothetical protein
MRRALQLVAVLALAGCAGSGGPTTATTAPDVMAPEQPPAGESESAPVGPAAAAEEPIFNRLKWSTASEVDNFGFDIYRSTSEEGPFERITGQPLPGAGTVDEPRYYEYRDEAIEPGVTYYYYVESISVDGIRETFSPIIKAPAKGTPAGGASEPRP